MFRDATIFVSVASYRDPETFMTVTDLLAKAKYPERVYVGVLSQIDRKTEFKFLAPFGKRIRQEVMDYRDSKGVCWARSRILTKLREKEEYVLQIDSHSMFKPNWDVKVLDMYRELNNNSVISTYPPSYVPRKYIDYNEKTFIYFCIGELTSPGIPKYSTGVIMDNTKHIRECGTIGVAGGCLFGHRSVFDRVPYDPYLYFFGEEPSYALRLFTHGIEIYSPTENFMFHYYNAINEAKVKDRVLHWEDHATQLDLLNKLSFDRLKYLFDLSSNINHSSLKDINLYGLGNVRTLKQWEAKLNIDLRNKYIGESAKTRIYY